MYDKGQEEFYISPKWKRFRLKILRRDKYQCQICKRYGRLREAAEVHHIEHLDVAPEKAFEPTNVISLCKACHRAQHPEKTEKATAARKGMCYVY